MQYESRIKAFAPGLIRLGGADVIAYDSLWTLAIALNKTEANLKASGKSLSDFNYTDQAIRTLLFNNIHSTSFEGISVSFNNIHYIIG